MVLILDFLFLEGYSFNDSIFEYLFLVYYIIVDFFIDGIIVRGYGIFMVKFDVVNVYRNVVIYFQDYFFLGMMWREKQYVDMVFFFGLYLVLYIFIIIVDIVQWMLIINNGIDFFRYYLDYFFILGFLAFLVCFNNLQVCVQLCFKLGFFFYSDKLEGFFICLFILGIELDFIIFQVYFSFLE